MIYYLGLREDNLLQYAAQYTDESIRMHYKCTLCNQTQTNKKSNIMNHIEIIHFPYFSYKCTYCSKILPTRSSYNKIFQDIRKGQ